MDDAHNGPDEPVNDLVDVSGLTLEQVRELDDSALKKALVRIIAMVDGTGAPVAGWQSAI